MKKQKINILILILLSFVPLFIMGGGLFLCCYPTGFGVHKIISKFSYNSSWEIEPVTDIQRELLREKVFSQTYYYLASGNHCYAFVSRDEQYILKFFKIRNLFPKDWLNTFPVSLLQFLGLKQESRNQLFSERIFASYKDAYEMFRKEAGLLYIHFNKTRDFKAKIKLIDNKGKAHLVDLDAVEFVVQRKAAKIYDYLGTLIRERKEEQLKLAVRSFLHLIAQRCEKGFVDHEIGIRNNFGFVDGEAVQFDCATLTRDNSMKYPMNFRKEVLEAAERLDFWAREHFTETSLLIQEEAQKVVRQSF